MSLAKLVWRVLPIAVVLWATRTGAIEWHAYYLKMRAVGDGLMTQVDMGGIARTIKKEYEMTGTMPDPYDFETYLRASMKSPTKPVHLDHFGTPYQIDLEDTSFTLRSAGPDKEAYTEDDLVVKVRSLGFRG